MEFDVRAVLEWEGLEKVSSKPRIAIGRWLGLLALLVLTACQPSAVDEPEPRAECEGNESRACSLETCGGVQECRDGRWGACECVASRVGRACEAEADCADREVCFAGDYLGGRAPQRFCTLRCDHEPALCEQRDPPAVCVVTELEGEAARAEAHCLPRCSVGRDEAGGDGVERCFGDERIACESVTSSSEDSAPSVLRRAADVGDDELSVCRPLCSSDTHCGSGRCDPRTGACAEPRQGSGFGRECDPHANDEGQCSGVCVEVDGVGFCSQRCRLGSSSDCGALGDGQSPGLCRFAAHALGSVGDVGFCSLLCNCDGDCSHDGMRCEAFDSPALEQLTGAVGVCTPSLGRAGLACDQPDAAPSPLPESDAGLGADASFGPSSSKRPM